MRRSQRRKRASLRRFSSPGIGDRERPGPGRHSEGRGDGVTRSSGRFQKCGGTRAASKLFLQAFPNLGCFCPSFSKESFGRFVGFQGVASLLNRKCGLSKSFVAARPFRPPSCRPRTTFRRLAPCGFEEGRRLAWVYGEVGQGARSWRSSDPDRENFEPSTHSVLWKEKSAPSLRDSRRPHRHGRARPGHPRRPTTPQFQIQCGARSLEHLGCARAGPPGWPGRARP